MYYNKEYKNRDYNNKTRDYNKGGRRKAPILLPPPSIMRAYEEISEGSAERLIEMAEYEQTHRHDWENAALQAYAKSHRLGQVCGMIVAIAVLYASLHAARDLHDQHLAIIIACCGFASIAISTLFAARNKRYEMRVRRAHYSDRKANQEEETEEDKEE